MIDQETARYIAIAAMSVASALQMLAAFANELALRAIDRASSALRLENSSLTTVHFTEPGSDEESNDAN